MVDFSKFKTHSGDAELIKGKSASRGPRMLRPGEHPVEIVSAEYTGPFSSDSTWQKLKIEVQRIGGSETIRHIVPVPTESLLYGASGTWAATKLSMFLEALGLDFEVDQLPEVLTKYLSRPELLVGLKLTVVVGYTKAYAHFIEKGVYQLRMPNGDPVLDENENHIVAESIDDAENICAELDRPFDRFPSVVRFGEVLVEEDDLERFEPKTKKISLKKVAKSSDSPFG